MRTGPLLVTAALLVALAGCVPTGGHGSASPSASATPVFASDAEALAAAEKAYAAYLKVSDEVAHDGGKDPERISAFVTPEQLAVEDRGSKGFIDGGIHTVGRTTFSNSSLEQVTSAGTDVTVVFYACWNASSVRILDSGGNDVTPTSRADMQTLEIVVTTVHGRMPLLLSSAEPWSGPSSC